MFRTISETCCKSKISILDGFAFLRYLDLCTLQNKLLEDKEGLVAIN